MMYVPFCRTKQTIAMATNPRTTTPPTTPPAIAPAGDSSYFVPSAP